MCVGVWLVRMACVLVPCVGVRVGVSWCGPVCDCVLVCVGVGVAFEWCWVVCVVRVCIGWCV